MKNDYSPYRDGVDHINIFYNSRSTLGRLLDNNTLAYFNHPKYGRFASVEGFRLWLVSGRRDNSLRTAYGTGLPKMRDLELVDDLSDEEVVKELRVAIRCKFSELAPIRIQMSLNPNIPFVSYRFSNGDILGNIEPKIQHNDYLDWAIEEWTDLRDLHLGTFDAI